MTTTEETTKRVMAAIARYMLPDKPVDLAAIALAGAVGKAAPFLNDDEAKERAQAVADAQEDGTLITALEALTALVGRSLLRAAITEVENPAPAQALKWLASHVTAASRNTPRVKAIWRHASDLGDKADAEIYDHALKSALAGKTLEPVPGATPQEPLKPGTEDKMLDPTNIRKEILKRFAFNRVGLPQKLRDKENQSIYLDAVVRGAMLMRNVEDEKHAMLWSAALAGLMLADGHYNPSDPRFYVLLQRAMTELSGSAEESGTVDIDAKGVKMFAPDGQTQRIAVFARTYEILRDTTDSKTPIFLQAFAKVGRRMSDRYEQHQGSEALMRPLAKSAYEKVVGDIASGGSDGGGDGGGIANVELPPLNDPAGYNDEIEPDNVRAISTIYVTYQLEFGLKAAARILDLFVAGLLPISASDGSARDLDNLYWEQDDLLDEASRRSVYSRVLGAPGGEMAFDIQPNSDFNTLLMRVVSAVSEYEREQSVLTHFDNAGRGRRFQSTTGEFVRKAIRDFAANASLRGWAGTAFTAERMAKHVRKVLHMLNLPSVRNAFGVTTPWQVIERVSQREFGITVNTVLHRTLAVETQTIMRIIADHHTIWSNGSGDRPLFSQTNLDEGQLPLATTRELMIACQHFRAVTGIGDTLLDEYAAPVETQPQPSLPDMANFGGMGGGAGGVDMAGLSKIRDMLDSGQTPSTDQLRAMLPGF